VPEVVELMKLKFSVYIYTMGPLEQAHKKCRQHDYRGYIVCLDRSINSCINARIEGTNVHSNHTGPRNRSCIVCAI
jgi:hypothetical protein